jgi:hypothetical protein
MVCCLCSVYLLRVFICTLGQLLRTLYHFFLNGHGIAAAAAAAAAAVDSVARAALVVIGSRALLVLDCSAILSQQQQPSAAAAVASTVGLFDLRILQQQQRLQRLDLPCWLGKCLVPAESVVLTAGLREESSGRRGRSCV